MEKFISIFIETFNQLSPYLMVGFLIAGFLSVVLTVEKISKYLGKQNFKSIFLASLFGVPIPLCSCGVIPVTAYLRKHGASKASATSFLISTPQTGIDSIMVTYGMLGPLMAIYRPIIAFISGIIGGLLINVTDKNKSGEVSTSDCEKDCCDEYDKNSKILSALHYGFVRLPLDIINPLVVGLILSAFISVFIEPGFFIDTINIGTGLTGMLVMLLISIPLYTCATASIPLAFVFHTSGFSMGAILVFLMAGPATNITTIVVTLNTLGKRSTFIYLMTIIIAALLSGYLLDFILTNDILEQGVPMHSHASVISLSSVGLFLVILNSYRIKYFSKKKDEVVAQSGTSFKVSGMTCSHCVESVKKTLMKLNGTKSVDVNLESGEVVVESDIIDFVLIKKTIEDLGFKVVND